MKTKLINSSTLCSHLRCYAVVSYSQLFLVPFAKQSTKAGEKMSTKITKIYIKTKTNTEARKTTTQTTHHKISLLINFHSKSSRIHSLARRRWRQYFEFSNSIHQRDSPIYRLARSSFLSISWHPNLGKNYPKQL